MLLTLIAGQSVQTLHSLDLTFMNIEDNHVNIEIHEWKPKGATIIFANNLKKN
jgi:hypothetical protein